MCWLPYFLAYITIWHQYKMFGYEFESIPQGFWVLSGARVGYIPFSGSVYYESQPKFLFSLMFCFFTIGHWDKMADYDFELFFCVWAWVHLGARYESQIKMSNETLLTKGDQHTYRAYCVALHSKQTHGICFQLHTLTSSWFKLSSIIWLGSSVDIGVTYVINWHR